MNIIVTGATGQLGEAVVKSMPPHYRLTALTRANLDISDANAVTETLEKSRPDVIINAAAYTQVDDAESNSDEALSINRDGAGNLAGGAARVGARLIHVSTDFVFSGRACEPYRTDEKPAPVSAYGESKAAGETAVLAEFDTTVIRTAWLYSSTGRNFALTMLRLICDGKDIRVVADQIGTPTWCASLAEAIWCCVASRPEARVLHWTDLGVASWYDFAVAIQDLALDLGLISQPVEIVPISTAEYPTPASRPAYSVLDTANTRRVLGLTGAHWRHNLRNMLEEV